MDATVSKSPLLQAVVNQIRVRHYSRRTEETYLQWIKRYIYFHNKRHPKEMHEDEVAQFLTDLAVRGNVSASTQDIALNSLVFLYRHLLEIMTVTAIIFNHQITPQLQYFADLLGDKYYCLNWLL
ncbi:MAG: phage integrase N-terminal SAM-like domain-containing protein [Candidatus Thiodiazotropha sp. L084R]